MSVLFGNLKTLKITMENDSEMNTVLMWWNVLFAECARVVWKGRIFTFPDGIIHLHQTREEDPYCKLLSLNTHNSRWIIA